MKDTEQKRKALIAVSDAFADNHLTYEDAINVMACYVKYIGKKCGSEERAAVLMIIALDRLMPELKHRV